MTRLVEYRHPEAGFSLPLPEAWERVDDTPGVALVAIEPGQEGWFRPNIVVTIERFPQETTLAEWSAASDALVEDGALHRYLRIDDERAEIGGFEARRVLAHHTTAENHAVTMEQWTLIANGCGYTLTASAGTLDYDQLADLFAAIAESFRPDPEYAP